MRPPLFLTAWNPWKQPKPNNRRFIKNREAARDEETLFERLARERIPRVPKHMVRLWGHYLCSLLCPVPRI